MNESSAEQPDGAGVGPARLGWFAEVDGIDLPAIDALVTGLGEVHTSIARLHAMEASMLSAVVDVLAQTMAARGVDQNMPWREMSAELAAAVHVSDRTMQARMGDAATLVHEFPAVHAALRDGSIDRARARVIVEVGTTLPAGDARDEYVATLLARAEELTAGRLGVVCRSVADRVHPESIDSRHARARRCRQVGVTDLDDGMARLFADLPATLARAIFDRLTQIAKTVQHAPDHTDAPDGADTGDAGAGGGDDAGTCGDDTNAGAGGGAGGDSAARDDAASDGNTASTENTSATVDATGSATANGTTATPGADGGDGGGERTLDQIRADVFADMLLTSVPDGHGPADLFENIVAHVQVIIPATALHPTEPATTPHPTEPGRTGTAGVASADPPGPFCDRPAADPPHGFRDGPPADPPHPLHAEPAAGLPATFRGGAAHAPGCTINPHTGQATTPVTAAAPVPAGRTSPTLTGAGPIDTATARILAGAANNWDRLFTDPHTGAILCVDRHDPNTHLKRLLKARDEHCRFPGCRQPVWRCEIDHTTRYRDGGPTCTCNLEHLCKGHHTLKHHTRWQVRQLPGGILQWTSPTGRTYTDHPPPLVRFTDTTPDPPPF
ncbi:DUF222 domain-containing protein [Microbacterium sp.]|uniref:HNH endonuclease signature motif containing protein n=1 Tax=Microbacterium sp. TaxID=51671 RepID=UPI003A8EB69C